MTRAGGGGTQTAGGTAGFCTPTTCGVTTVSATAGTLGAGGNAMQSGGYSGGGGGGKYGLMHASNS